MWGTMLTISPPRALGGEIVDMVILGVIFFHDFNPNPNPNKIQWGGNSRLGQSGGEIVNMVPCGTTKVKEVLSRLHKI